MGVSDDDEAAAFVRAHRRRWMNWGIPLIAVVVVLGGAAAFAMLAGKNRRGFGQPCESNRDCAGNGLCVVAEAGAFCTLYCEKPADCPAGWLCEPHWELNDNGDKAGGMMMACAKR